MPLHQILMITKMALDPRCIRLLLKVNGIFRDDPNYNLQKIIRTSLDAIRGEKILHTDAGYLFSSFIPPVPSRAFFSMLCATPESKHRFTQQSYLRRTAPISFYLALTDRCNYACTHCSAKGRIIGKELTTQEWKDTISDLQEMGVAIIGFTGGEPLLREDLEELITSIDDRSITYVFTNGAGLSSARAQALKRAGLFGIGISLDSPQPCTNDDIRGSKGAFDAALAAMEHASAAGLYVMAQTVLRRNMLHPSERENLIKLFKLAKSHGAREVRLLEPICSGNLLAADNPEGIFYTDEDRQAIIKLQEDMNRSFSFPKITAFAHTEDADHYGCGAGNQHSYISPDGQLYPCDFVPLSFGNVHEHNIRDLWNGMSGIIGKPKCKCFAMTIGRQLCKVNDISLPLSRDKSEAICQSHQSNKYPAFFESLQK